MNVECLWGGLVRELYEKHGTICGVEGFWPQLKHETRYRMGNKNVTSIQKIVMALRDTL